MIQFWYFTSFLRLRMFMRYLRDTYNSSSEEPLLFSTAFTKQKLLPIKHFLLLQLLRTLRSVVKHVFKKCIYAFNDEAYDLANSFDMTKILEYQNYVELTKLFHLAKERYNLLLKYFFLKEIDSPDQFEWKSLLLSVSA